MRSRTDSAPPAGRSLSYQFIKALDERFGRGPDALSSRWREIVGETLALRTEPVKLSKPRNGAGAVLELKVDGPAAALIQHQAPEILARVNMVLGQGAVARLRITQGVIRRPSCRHAARPRASPGPAATRPARSTPPLKPNWRPASLRPRTNACARPCAALAARCCGESGPTPRPTRTLTSPRARGFALSVDLPPNWSLPGRAR